MDMREAGKHEGAGLDIVTEESFGLGLIGCGSFGRFCLRAFDSMPGVRAAAVTGILPEPARRTGEEFGLPVCSDIHELTAREDVQIVHIATPPATHSELAITALRAGKHVLCEKPLATDMAEALRMADAAKTADCFLAVNLIMRYNPLNQAVAKILHSGLLGSPLHAYFENDAGDTLLGPDHWFWDRQISGGIFIEHGVHFFDLFQMWFGPGEIVAAQRSQRPHSQDIFDQVTCTARYGGVLATFYHGFHQPNRMELQETQIICERGRIRLREWVSTSIEVEFIGLQSELEALVALVPNASVETVALYDNDEREILGRHKTFKADGRFRIQGNTGMAKMDLYTHLIRTLLSDQILYAKDHRHQRLVTEENGVTSLAMAIEADRLSKH